MIKIIHVIIAKNVLESYMKLPINDYPLLFLKTTLEKHQVCMIINKIISFRSGGCIGKSSSTCCVPGICYSISDKHSICRYSVSYCYPRRECPVTTNSPLTSSLSRIKQSPPEVKSLFEAV